MYWDLGLIIITIYYIVIISLPLIGKFRKKVLWVSELQEDNIRTLELMFKYDTSNNSITIADKLEFFLRYSGYICIVTIVSLVSFIVWPIVIIATLIALVGLLRELE